jgi:hypothetical protein
MESGSIRKARPESGFCFLQCIFQCVPWELKLVIVVVFVVNVGKNSYSDLFDL